MTGRAAHSQLRDLWAALKDNLLDCLKGPKRPSAEHLGCVRKFLRDNGEMGLTDPAGRKQLSKLQRLYLERLVEAIEEGPPSSALLGEARQFLAWAGQSPDLGPRAAAHTAEQLLALEVPFKTTQ